MADSGSSGHQEIMGYTLGQRLGYGAFSWAIVGEKPDHPKVALKFTKQSHGSERAKQRQLSEIMTELRVFEKVRHPNIVRLYEFQEGLQYTHSNGNVDTVFGMALELCEGGELFDIVYYTGKLDEKITRTFFRQIASAVKALHDNSLCHRDIKPQNVLLTDRFVAKLADFGSSKEFTLHSLMRTTRVGTKGYQASELLLNRGYTKKCDIFALGVLLFVCLTKHPPFKNATAEDPWFRQIAKKAFMEFWRKHPKDRGLSDDVKDLIVKMLCYQPLDRIDIDEVLAHPWTQQDVYDEDEIVDIMGDLKTRASQLRSEDNVRAPENFDSTTVRDGAGWPAPRQIFAARKFNAFSIPWHPNITLRKLLNEFHVSRKWEAQILETESTLNLTTYIQITDEEDFLYNADGVPVKVEIEIQGYSEAGVLPDDFEKQTGKGSGFYFDVRIISEFNEPSVAIYNDILCFLGMDDLPDSDDEDEE